MHGTLPEANQDRTDRKRRQHCFHNREWKIKLLMFWAPVVIKLSKNSQELLPIRMRLYIQKKYVGQLFDPTVYKEDK